MAQHHDQQLILVSWWAVAQHHEQQLHLPGDLGLRHVPHRTLKEHTHIHQSTNKAILKGL